MGYVKVRKAISRVARLLMLVVGAAAAVTGCDVETYDDAVSRIPENTAPPPPASPPPPPPPPPPAAGFGPNFSEIQANVFDTECVGCHSAGNASGGLNLEAASSYSMLVDVPSNGDPGIDRVEPGQPNNSYLVQKLEGEPSAGQQMPPGAPLPQAEIDVIRQWITDGAIDDTVVPPQAPITVTSLSPMPNAALTAPPTSIVAGFSRELNQTTVSDMTFLLTASGGDGDFTGEPPIAPVSVTIGANPMSAVMDLTGVTLNDDTYRVTLVGSGSPAIMDLDGNLLDGEYMNRFPTGDGIAGGDFIVQFTLTTPVVIGPTLAQIQAVVFSPKCASCHDGVGNNLPGSMNLSSEAASLNSLVDTPSENDPLMQDRVEPGMPDLSYLMDKIDGTDPQQMPPSGPLPQAEIDAIRQWILDLPQP